MSLADALRSACRGLPDEASISLPVAWIREQLGETGGEPHALADLTVSDVATALDRAESTVRGWCIEGALTSYKLRNREWRVTREALREFQDRQGEPKPKHTDDDDIGAWRRYRSKDGEAA